MTVAGKGVEDLVSARLLELVDARTPWHRSLWQAGSILALQEVLEYAQGVRTGAIRPEGLVYVASSASEQVARDHGIGAEPRRDAIAQVLKLASDKAKGPVNSHVADSLEQMTRTAETGYLRRWAAVVGGGQLSPQDGELLARLVVAHLLDAGFAPDHIHGWLLAQRKKASLEDLLLQADEMCHDDPSVYEVLVPFEQLPASVRQDAGDRFTPWSVMTADLERQDLEKPPGRQGPGALTFKVNAREPWSAISTTEIEIRRLSARAVVGLSGEPVAAVGWAMVMGPARPKWRPLRSRQREILVSSIARNGLLLPQARSSATAALDDAFELLAAVETSTSWASVAAIWAAVEGLLARSTDAGVAAADRMAAVVTASFVRAELVDLATTIRGFEGPIPDAMRDESVPFTQRLNDLLGAIEAGEGLPDLQATDLAAVARVKTVAHDPKATLDRVRGYLVDAFRRLFQQRNQLLHGGRFNSIALPMTMRTAPMLVAAGMDRLVHAAVNEPGMRPLALAARAENELSLLGKDGARSLHQLLD